MKQSNLLAMDIGDERVGIAMARSEVRVPVPLTTLLRSEPAFWEKLTDIIGTHDISKVILGLPRNLNGQETAQTSATRVFGAELTRRTGLPVLWQDEALTSVKAEAVLKNTGKPYNKADIDALAACYILSDYIDNPRVIA